MVSHARGHNGESATDKSSIWTRRCFPSPLLPLLLLPPSVPPSLSHPPLFSQFLLLNFLPVCAGIFFLLRRRPRRIVIGERLENEYETAPAAGGPFFDAWCRRGPHDSQRRRHAESPEAQRPSGIGHDEVAGRSPASHLSLSVHLVPPVITRWFSLQIEV